MSVRPVDMLMLQQINQVSHIKQSEDVKPMAEQMNIVNDNQKQTEVHSEQVNSKDNVDDNEGKYDARDKSDNEYHSSKDNKKKEKITDGVVKIKSAGKEKFDIKI